MSENLIQRFEDLLLTGGQLAPLGGFEFSGYNARLQNKYLEWRRMCLEIFEDVGPIGFPYKNKVLADANGGYFFQSSAQLIVNALKELSEKVKNSPDLVKGAAAPAAASEPAASAPATAPAVSAPAPAGARVIKPPPKPAAAAPAPASVPAPAPAAAPAAAGASKRVYVIGEANDPLRQELSSFLGEIGVEEVAILREHGQMLALNAIEHQPDIKYAFFVINNEDLSYAMFELGHFVGKLGSNHVCVLHMTDLKFPAGVPGITVRPVVIKLEEVSFSIIKELKSIGYAITL